MNDRAGVVFRTPAGQVRPPASVDVDFRRVLASDSLISRPPQTVSSILSLLGWLDEAVDWVNLLLPFR